MRKIMFIALALLASASLSTAEAAKKDKKKKQEAVAQVVQPVVLQSSSDSLSYAAGRAVTNGLMNYLKQQGVDSTHLADFVEGFKEAIAATGDSSKQARMKGMDIASQLQQRMLPGIKQDFTDTPDSIVEQLLYRGFTDAILGDTVVMQQQAAEEFFKQKQATNKAAKEEKLYGANRDAGRQFLAENKQKEGVITTPSGLQYKILVKGDGEVPQRTDKVKVHYEGRLVDGTVFDASSKHGTEPSSFRADQVIKGWTEALTMMPVGSKWQLYIPYELAYGDRNMGNIKPFSMLIFDVELVGIDKK